MATSISGNSKHRMRDIRMNLFIHQIVYLNAECLLYCSGIDMNAMKVNNADASYHCSGCVLMEKRETRIELYMYLCGVLPSTGSLDNNSLGDGGVLAMGKAMAKNSTLQFLKYR